MLSLPFEAQICISDLSQNVERPIGPVFLQNKHAWIAGVGEEEHYYSTKKPWRQFCGWNRRQLIRTEQPF